MGGVRPADAVRIDRAFRGTYAFDFEKSLVCDRCWRRGSFEPADSLFSAVRRMSSDFEKAVLRQLRPTPAWPRVQEGLPAVPSISSISNGGRVLRAMLDAQPLDPALRIAFVDAANHIGSRSNRTGC